MYFHGYLTHRSESPVPYYSHGSEFQFWKSVNPRVQIWVTHECTRAHPYHNISNKNDTCPVRCIPSFEFFHKPYQVLELIPCTEYLSPESQKSHFWKLKIGHHNCAGIKYICSKYYLQILEEFHQKLNELQQLEDELENNVRKWHWVGHVQKTIMS